MLSAIGGAPFHASRRARGAFHPSLPLRPMLLWQALVRLVGNGDHAAWIELPHRPYQTMLPVFRASLRLENLLAIGGQILYDALVAIVAERHWIDLGGAV